MVKGFLKMYNLSFFVNRVCTLTQREVGMGLVIHSDLDFYKTNKSLLFEKNKQLKQLALGFIRTINKTSNQEFEKKNYRLCENLFN